MVAQGLHIPHEQHFTDNTPPDSPPFYILFIMDPVSHNLDIEAMDSEDGSEVADLKAQLGELQMGGGGEMLIDDYDVVDEKPDVAIITPDESPEEPEPEVLADDCMHFQMSPFLF